MCVQSKFSVASSVQAVNVEYARRIQRGLVNLYVDDANIPRYSDSGRGEVAIVSNSYEHGENLSWPKS